MSLSGRSYEETCRLFRWRLPPRLNAAADTVDRHASGAADGHRTALLSEDETGAVFRYSFVDLAVYSNRLANLMASRGLEAGDRVMLLLPPSGEAAIAMLATLKLGAVVVPLPDDAPDPVLRRELKNLDIRAVFCHARWAPLMAKARDKLPDLRLALAADGSAKGVADFWTALSRINSDYFAPADTTPDDPAFIFHESPLLEHDKSYQGRLLLYGHRAVRARMPAVEHAHSGFPQAGDLLWTPSDWARDGAWLDTVLPAWSLGGTVLAAPLRRSSCLLSRLGVRNVQVAARHLLLLGVALGETPPMLRSLLVSGPMSASEEKWLREHLATGTPLSRAAGGPLCSGLLGPSPLYRCPAGALGRPPPGYAVDIVNERGRVVPAGEIGTLAVNSQSPLLPLGVVQAGQAELGPLPLLGAWLPVGVKARKDLDGTFWPVVEAESDASSPVLVPPSASAAPLPPLRAPGRDERWR